MPRTPIVLGSAARCAWTVAADDTAAALGSGDLDVLATPRLLAWMERVACLAIEAALAEDETSVGTRVALEHLKPSPVDARIDVTATVAHVDGRLVRLEAVAVDASDAVVGRSDITRVVVETERFLGRITGTQLPP
jgi:predicted thioesterase